MLSAPKQRLEISLDLLQRTFFQPADLSLANADFTRHLHLGFAGKKAQGEDFFSLGVRFEIASRIVSSSSQLLSSFLSPSWSMTKMVSPESE